METVTIFNDCRWQLKKKRKLDRRERDNDKIKRSSLTASNECFHTISALDALPFHPLLPHIFLIIVQKGFIHLWCSLAWILKFLKLLITKELFDKVEGVWKSKKKNYGHHNRTTTKKTQEKNLNIYVLMCIAIN